MISNFVNGLTKNDIEKIKPEESLQAVQQAFGSLKNKNIDNQMQSNTVSRELIFVRIESNSKICFSVMHLVIYYDVVFRQVKQHKKSMAISRVCFVKIILLTILIHNYFQR